MFVELLMLCCLSVNRTKEVHSCLILFLYKLRRFAYSAMNLKQLHQFVVLSETLSFTTAAARLSMSQPPLSVSIRLLEDEIGERLFERSTGGVKLTVVGRSLIEHAGQPLRRSPT